MFSGTTGNMLRGLFSSILKTIAENSSLFMPRYVVHSEVIVLLSHRSKGNENNKEIICKEQQVVNLLSMIRIYSFVVAIILAKCQYRLEDISITTKVKLVKIVSMPSD